MNTKIEKNGILCPEQIIYEPDYLLEISTIARCWKEYGDHPCNYLLEKISPARNTPAMLLGNLAGQFLDETINTQDLHENSYNNSIKRFFIKSALKIITCEESLKDFHHQAKEQMKKHYEGRYKIICNLPEREGADYADLAKEKKQANKCRDRPLERR